MSEEANTATGAQHQTIDIQDNLQHQPPLNSARPDLTLGGGGDKNAASRRLPPINEANTPPQHEIDIPDNLQSQQPPATTSVNQPPQLPDLPLRDFLDGSREQYLKVCVPLYKASITGNWRAAESIINKHPDVVRYGITQNLETALHVAASAKSSKSVEDFVENLVNKMTKEDLQLQNKNGNTSLCLATAAGSVKMAESMVNKNHGLLDIPGSSEMMPLYMAALFGNREMVMYLYEKSKTMHGDFWTPKNRGWVVLKCVEAELFDVAMKMLTDNPGILNHREDFPNSRKDLPISSDILRVLAQKPEAFKEIEENAATRIINSIFVLIRLKKIGPARKESQALQLLKIVWKNVVEKPMSEIEDIIRGPQDNPVTRPARNNYKKTFSLRVLFVAAEMGNTKFLVELISQYPDLIFKKNDNGLSIFHVAVLHRHESIYNLLYEIGSNKDLLTPLKDENNGNNMLHLVGKIPKNERLQVVSGVALRMQRELLWFKEVKDMMPPSYRERKNKDGLTPHELFTEEHKDLLSQGEKWMKGTASNCMVVATLIATIAFAAAFTIPGGYDQDNGIPTFIQNRFFIVFAISDAISLFSSSASILMFLSILTSRYAERDFLESLPRKLMLGLLTLFFSISSMMIAFTISFFVLYHKGLIWVPILLCALGAAPIILFGVLQFRLFFDVLRSIYGARYLFKPKKHLLYTE